MCDFQVPVKVYRAAPSNIDFCRR